MDDLKKNLQMLEQSRRLAANKDAIVEALMHGAKPQELMERFHIDQETAESLYAENERILRAKPVIEALINGATIEDLITGFGIPEEKAVILYDEFHSTRGKEDGEAR